MKNKIRQKVGAYSMSGRRMIPSARVWPNGEFSLGYAWEGEESPELPEWAWTGGSKGLTEEELDVRLECLHGWLDAVTQAYSVSGKLAQLALTLSNARNSEKEAEPTKYGLHGITGTGAKMLRSAAFIMERDYGCSDVTMGTFTVPHLEKEERVRLAQRWGVLTNDLVRYLRSELEQQGRPPVVAGCTEIQSARLEARNEGYLHLHAIWPAHSNCGRRWAVVADDVRAWWKRAIERIIGRELPVAPRVETAIVEFGVEHYIGKYLSKGGDDLLGQFVADLGYESVPGQWWFMSNYLKQKIKAETLTGRSLGTVLEAYIEHTVTSGTGAGFEWLRHVDLNVDGRLLTVGYVGRLDRPTRDDLALLLRIDSELDLFTVDGTC
jgi:hypothetical protein